MVKCLNIGKNIGKPIYIGFSISSWETILRSISTVQFIVILYITMCKYCAFWIIIFLSQPCLQFADFLIMWSLQMSSGCWSCDCGHVSEMPTGLKLVYVVLSIHDTYAYRWMLLYVSMRLIVLLVCLSVFMWQTFNMLNAMFLFPTSLSSTSWSLRDLLALKHSPVENCKHSEPHNLLSLRHFSLSHAHTYAYIACSFLQSLHISFRHVNKHHQSEEPLLSF